MKKWCRYMLIQVEWNLTQNCTNTNHHYKTIKCLLGNIQGLQICNILLKPHPPWPYGPQNHQATAVFSRWWNWTIYHLMLSTPSSAKTFKYPRPSHHQISTLPIQHSIQTLKYKPTTSLQTHADVSKENGHKTSSS